MKYAPGKASEVTRSLIETSSVTDVLTLVAFWVFVLGGIYACFRAFYGCVFTIRYKLLEMHAPSKDIRDLMKPQQQRDLD